VEQALVTKQDGELARRAAGDGVRVRGTAWDIGLDHVPGGTCAARSPRFRPDVIHVTTAMRCPQQPASQRVRPSWRRAEWTFTSAASARGGGPTGSSVSAAVKDILTGDGIAPDRIVVVPDSIDPDEVRRASTPPLGTRASSWELSEKTPLAVNAAAGRSQDQRTLVRAPHARTLEPGLHWVIAGEALRASLNADISRLGSPIACTSLDMWNESTRSLPKPACS
jgi:hypothetical protein